MQVIGLTPIERNLIKQKINVHKRGFRFTSTSSQLHLNFDFYVFGCFFFCFCFFFFLWYMKTLKLMWKKDSDPDLM